MPDRMYPQQPDREARPAGDERPTTACCIRAMRSGVRFCPDCGRGLKPLSPVREAFPSADQVPEPTEPAPEREPTAAPAKPNEPNPQTIPGVARIEAAATCDCGRRLPEDARFCPGCGERAGSRDAGTWLTWSRPDETPVAVRFADEELIIGKDENCDLVITQDTYVSRRHARLRQADRLIFVEDLGSANGTLLRIHRPIVLEHGDELVIGTTVVRLEQR